MMMRRATPLRALVLLLLRRRGVSPLHRGTLVGRDDLRRPRLGHGGLVRSRTVTDGHGPEDRAADEAGEPDSAEGEAERRRLRQAWKPEDAEAPPRADDGNAIDELELLGERTAGAEDECLDGRKRQPELERDLGVGAPLDLAEEDCLTLRVGEAQEGCMDVRRGRAVVLVQGEQELRVELDLLRPLATKPGAAADDVTGDGKEPGARLLRRIAAAHRPEGVQERSLRDVLGLIRIAHVAQHRPVYLAPVPTVDPLERAIRVHGLVMPPKHTSQAC
jgi:hypothetical protein